MDTKICVAGIGAVGGVLAGMLGKQYASNLSLLARGPRADALRRNGIVLHSEFYGEVAVRPEQISANGSDLGIQDFVLICVKNYSLNQIAESLRPAIGDHTVVIPVLNGIEAGDRVRELFPNAIVCDSVIYTTTASNADYSVTQRGPYTHLFLGSKIKEPRYIDGARAFYSILRSVGFDIRWSDDIEHDIWEKFILNCAFNTLTARYLATTGTIRRDQSMKEDIYALLSETYRVALSEGVSLPDDIVAQKFAFIMEKQADTATSSMKRDVEAKRPTEIDALSGAVIRKAEKNGIEVPVMRRYHQELSQMIAAYGKES